MCVQAFSLDPAFEIVNWQTGEQKHGLSLALPLPPFVS